MEKKKRKKKATSSGEGWAAVESWQVRTMLIFLRGKVKDRDKDKTEKEKLGSALCVSEVAGACKLAGEK